MIIQCTLLTCHKGVDLHAETAARVIRDRLDGGDRLISLRRAEIHTFWRDPEKAAPETVTRMLGVGRFYNPNKHHYAHFELPEATGPWNGGEGRGAPLPSGWPGEELASDLPSGPESVYDRLLGGPAPEGAVAVDVCAYPLAEPNVPLTGVLWRLVLAEGSPDAETVARGLVEARGARQGLLVNPHMQGWLVAQKDATA